MPRPRFERLSAERQEAILAAAAEEFAARGYEGASLNRILERTGTSKGALYYYFDDKADLFGTVIDRAVAHLLGGAEPPLSEWTAADYWDGVRDFMLRSYAHVQHEDWCARVMRSLHRLWSEPAARAVSQPALERARELTSALLRRGRELGAVRSDLPLELLVAITMAADEAGDRWLLERWESLPEGEVAALQEARLDLLRDMLDARHEGWES